MKQVIEKYEAELIFGIFRPNSCIKISLHAFVSRHYHLSVEDAAFSELAAASALSAVTARVSISVVDTVVQARERKHLSGVTLVSAA